MSDDLFSNFKDNDEIDNNQHEKNTTINKKRNRDKNNDFNEEEPEFNTKKQRKEEYN